MSSGGMDAESSANGVLVNIEPPPVARILRGGGKVKPKKGLCGYRKNFEAHRGQIAERPGGRRGEPGDGAGIDQPGPASLDVRHLLDACAVRMAAADEVFTRPILAHGQAR